MQPILRNAWVAFAGLIGSGLASAALVVAPLDGVTVTKEMLAANLLGAGSGITITNVAYTGANGMAGTFAGGGGILGIASGILLTSGSVFNVVGPNQSPGITTIADVPGDPDLTVLAGDETYDASVLTITFVPTGNQVRFSYVFASEEYNEFIDQYNDVFGFFVNGVNRALVPGATLPVAINNINCGETGAGTGPNCNLFVDNTAGTLDTEFDGLTKVLTLTAAVTPNVPNTLKIAIADTGDSIYDSGIFVANIRGSTNDVAGILNEIAGTTGNDILKAIKGIDNLLIGDLGTDKLFANTGADFLQGDDESGAEATSKYGVGEVAASESFKDKFIFKSVKVLDKKIDKTDVVLDFDEKDVIDFSKMTGPQLDFIGKKGFSGNGDGEVRYKQVKAENSTAVSVDTNGDGKTDASLKLLGLYKLNDGDFAL